MGKKGKNEAVCMMSFSLKWSVYLSCNLKIDKDDIKTVLISEKNWNLYKFCNTSVNFEDTKMKDHIFKNLKQ